MLRPLLACLVVAAVRPALADEGALAHARTLQKEGDAAHAAAALEALAPGDANLWFEAGAAWQSIGALKDAARCFQRAVDGNAPRAEEARRLVTQLRDPPPGGDDVAAPRFLHTPPTSPQPAGRDVYIAATISDPSGVFAPMAYFRAGSTGPFVQMAMNGGENDKYAAIVPPVAKKGEELQYFLEAYDKLGNGPARDGTPTYPHVVRIGLNNLPPPAPLPPPPVLVRREPPPPLPPPAPRPPPLPPEPHGHGVSITLGVVAAAALGTGGFFGYESSSTAKSIAATPHPTADLDTMLPQVKQNALYANVALGVGGGIAVVALVVLLAGY